MLPDLAAAADGAGCANLGVVAPSEIPNLEFVASKAGKSEHATLVQNRKKHRQNSHLIIHCPTSEGVSEVSKRASE